MRGREITLWLDERWYDALSKQLKGETLEEHLENILDEMCNQLPQREYERISHELWAEQQAEEEAREAARRFAVFHVTENGGSDYILAEEKLELLSTARRLRSYIRKPPDEAPHRFVETLLHTQRISQEEFNSYVLPPANSNMRRVYAYLVKHRNIDRSVVAHFAREKLLYEDADYHNAVFVGTDEDGVPRHAHKRSANSFGKAFRLNVEGCDPRHSFHHIGTDGSLYVFEAPIDMLSYITLHPEGWQSHSYVACCGTSIQPVLKLLERQPQINTVLLCLDNDEAGHLASRRMKEQLAERYTVERLIPAHKDWNDDLTAEEPSFTQVMQ